MIIGLGMPRVGDCYSDIVSNHIMIGYDIGRCSDVDHLRMFDVQNVFPFDKARNCLMESAINHECDYLFFVDADVSVPLGGFQILLNALISNNAQAVSGHYRRRGHPFTCVWTKENVLKDGTKMFSQVDCLNSGIHKIDSSGLGCCLIDLGWVKENLKKPYFDMGRKENGDYFWEDAFFFSKMGEAKGLILGHGGVRCGHLMTERIIVSDDNWKGLLKDSSVIVGEGFSEKKHNNPVR